MDGRARAQEPGRVSGGHTPETRVNLRPESFTLELTLAGRAAGEMNWTITPEKHAWIARVQTDFSGILPELRRVQTSRVHPRSLTSLGYSEGDGRRVTFETAVDRKGGLITVKQGRDEASAPLITDLHDPVSIVLWLRANLDVDRAEAFMSGGRVHIRRLPDTDVLGVSVNAYELRPGGAVVYVEAASPRRLMKLVQPTDFGPVDGTLRQERAKSPRNESPKRRRR